MRLADASERVAGAVVFTEGRSLGSEDRQRLASEVVLQLRRRNSQKSGVSAKSWRAVGGGLVGAVQGCCLFQRTKLRQEHDERPQSHPVRRPCTGVSPLLDDGAVVRECGDGVAAADTLASAARASPAMNALPESSASVSSARRDAVLPSLSPATKWAIAWAEGLPSASARASSLWNLPQAQRDYGKAAQLARAVGDGLQEFWCQGSVILAIVFAGNDRGDQPQAATSDRVRRA